MTLGDREGGTVIYNNATMGMMATPPAKPTCGRRVNYYTKDIIMGDRSPKANQKKTTQKQGKASASDQKKQQAIASKQSAGKKK